jgi:hypothetical protein
MPPVVLPQESELLKTGSVSVPPAKGAGMDAGED